MTNEFKPDIWRLQAQYDIQGLIRALQADESVTRKRAAAALRAIGARESIPALRLALMNEPDPETRASIAAALEALMDTGEHEAVAEPLIAEEDTLVERLIQQLHDKDPQQVIDAARQLGDLQNKLAVEPLVVLFRDARVSIQVRLAAAEALLKLEGAPVEATLLANLRNPEWTIRRKAAAILGQLKADWAVLPLAKALRDPHPIVRRTARAALKYIGTLEARRALAQAANHPNGQPGQGAAPGGLLKRAEQAQKAQDAPPKKQPAPGDTQIHLKPTQPLDPEVLKRVEEQQRKNKDNE